MRWSAKDADGHMDPTKCQEKKGKASFFYVYLGEGFLQSMTIPCFMRGMFNKNMIAMSPEKDEYIFDVKKNYVRTLIFGPEYEKMLADFDMKSGDMARFEWDHLNDAFFAFYPLGPDGVLKGRVLEPHVFEDAAKSVVFSEGLTLTAGQTGRMNHHVLTRGLGLGHVFVHTITVTDVAHNGLRIPKEISSVLNIDEGKTILIYGYDGANFELSYYTCRDQRICFRGGWQQFAKLHNLDEGVVVLILFHNDNDGRLVLSFDAI